MIQKGLTGIMVFLFIGVNIVSAFNVDLSNTTMPMNRGDTLYVGGSGPGNYTTIQSAINAASDGDTVFVYDDSSPYREHVIINKIITLIGEDKNTTVIDGRYSGTTVKISANEVVLAGFTIQGGIGEGAGISIESNGNEIFDNIIKNNGAGLEFQYGIYLGPYSDNVIRNNDIIYNKFGIEIYDLSKKGNNNLITGNFIAHNIETGIFDRDQDGGTTATWNVIADNGDPDYYWYHQCGVHKYGAYTIFHHNDFFFNYAQVQLQARHHSSIWDDGSEGNFWDDWEQNPGYPDTYIIYNGPQGPKEIDYHPSATPYNNRPVVGLSPKHYFAPVGEPIYFTADTSVDPDAVSWHWDFGDGTTSDEAYPTHPYNSSGFYRISVTITDTQGRSDTSYSDARIGIAPNTPTITGPTKVKVGTLNNYTIVTTDPDDDFVLYYIMYAQPPWHTDFTVGPYKSGEEAIVGTRWDIRGGTTIWVKAIDGSGLESDYATLDVTIPRTHSFNSLFMKFFERFPRAFPILRHLLYL